MPRLTLVVLEKEVFVLRASRLFSLFFCSFFTFAFRLLRGFVENSKSNQREKDQSKNVKIFPFGILIYLRSLSSQELLDFQFPDIDGNSFHIFFFCSKDVSIHHLINLYTKFRFLLVRKTYLLTFKSNT